MKHIAIFYAVTSATIEYDYTTGQERCVDMEVEVFSNRNKIMNLLEWFDKSDFKRVKIVAVNYKDMQSLRSCLYNMIENHRYKCKNFIEVYIKHGECFLEKIRELYDYEKIH